MSNVRTHVKEGSKTVSRLRGFDSLLISSSVWRRWESSTSYFGCGEGTWRRDVSEGVGHVFTGAVPRSTVREVEGSDKKDFFHVEGGRRQVLTLRPERTL